MSLAIYAIVSRIPRETLGQIEYVADEADTEFQLAGSAPWTKDRAKAKVFDLRTAKELAARIGFPAHAVVCSRACAPAPIRRGPMTTPEAAFERLAERGLA